LNFFHHGLEVRVFFEVLFADGDANIFVVNFGVEEEFVHGARLVHFEDDRHSLLWDFSTFGRAVDVVERVDLGFF